MVSSNFLFLNSFPRKMGFLLRGRCSALVNHWPFGLLHEVGFLLRFLSAQDSQVSTCVCQCRLVIIFSLRVLPYRA
jgi:hypothetical protein